MPPRKRKFSKIRKDPEIPPSGSENSDDEPDSPSFKRLDTAARADRGLVSTFFVPQRTKSKRSTADLNVCDGDEMALRELVASLPERDPNAKTAIRVRLEGQFPRWWFEWKSGYSLLFYGLGSKRTLLHKFATECTPDGPVIEVDGLLPGLTARHILAATAALAKGMKPEQFHGWSPAEMLEEVASESLRRRIYLVIHNIDGPRLQDTGAQRMLSELAALPNVHLAASVDHVNFPLLWDLQTKDRFQWMFHQTATFQPYINEVQAAEIPSLLGARKEVTTQEGALVVLSSLSNSAREVFRLIVDAQVQQEGAGGITFNALFSTCRERFIVSNEPLLRTMLTEFRTHDLLQSKRGQDGGDLLYVPLEAEVLRQVLAGMGGGS